jgi:hypothetical protein
VVLPVEVLFGKPLVNEPIAFVTPARAPLSGLLLLDDVAPPAWVDGGVTLFPDTMFGALSLVASVDSVSFE